MALFAISCIDKPDSLALRMATRQSHLTYANGGQTLVKVKLGGPYLDEQGNMAGSLLIVEAPDRRAVEEFSRNDPYVTAGLFQSVEIRPYRITVGPPM
ncbi:MAG: YciI family protein [Alphaproteobacteria bacterium]|nr:YciI family protein [Alphaproteobacteria bacterium]